MNINELLQTLKKDNPDWASPNPNIFYELGFEELRYENFDNSPLKGWHHQDVSWTCTDTRVGVEFIFLNEEFVGVSIQSARKNNIYYQWVSEEAYSKVRRWMAEEYLKINNVELIDFSAEINIQWIRDYSFNQEYSFND